MVSSATSRLRTRMSEATHGPDIGIGREIDVSDPERTFSGCGAAIHLRGWRSFFRQSYPSENVAVAGSVGRVHQWRFALDPRDRVVGLELPRSRDRFLRLLQMAQYRS